MRCLRRFAAPGFNGAGTARSRKCAPAHTVGRSPHASMGPGPRGPGNTQTANGDSLIVRLQWGRDRAVPEMLNGHPDGKAILGLQWGRDRAVPEMLLHDAQAVLLGELQWGRDRAVPEI